MKDKIKVRVRTFNTFILPLITLDNIDDFKKTIYDDLLSGLSKSLHSYINDSQGYEAAGIFNFYFNLDTNKQDELKGLITAHVRELLACSLIDYEQEFILTDTSLTVRLNRYKQSTAFDYVEIIDDEVYPYDEPYYNYLDYIKRWSIEDNEVGIQYSNKGEGNSNYYDYEALIDLIRQNVKPINTFNDGKLSIYELTVEDIYNGFNKGGNFTLIDGMLSLAVWDNDKSVLIMGNECFWGSTENIVYLSDEIMDVLVEAEKRNEITLI